MTSPTRPGTAIIYNAKYYLICRRSENRIDLLPLRRVPWTCELIVTDAVETVCCIDAYREFKLSNNVGDGFYCVRGELGNATVLLENMSSLAISEFMSQPRSLLQRISRKRTSEGGGSISAKGHYRNFINIKSKLFHRREFSGNRAVEWLTASI